MAHTIDEDTKKIVKAIVHGDQKRQSRRRAGKHTDFLEKIIQIFPPLRQKGSGSDKGSKKGIATGRNRSRGPASHYRQTIHKPVI